MRTSVEEVLARLPAFLEMVDLAKFEKRCDDLLERAEDPILAPGITSRHALELAIFLVRNRLARQLPIDIGDPRTYAGVSFVATVLAVHDRLSEAAQLNLSKELAKGLRSHDGFQPTAHELTTGLFLAGLGFDVEFADLERTAPFDLLVSRGGVSAEVECKCLSADRGRKVHRRDFEALAQRLFPVLQDQLAKCNEDFCVEIELADRLPKDVGSHESLRAQVEVVLDKGEEQTDRSCRVRSGSLVLSDAQRAAIRGKRGLLATNDDGHLFVAMDKGGGAGAIRVMSRKPDQVVKEIRSALKRATAKQLSGSRPGIAYVEIRDVSAVELQELSDEPTSALHGMTRSFLASPNRAHVQSIVYIVRGLEDVKLRDGGLYASGRSLHFANPDHPLAFAKELDTRVAPEDARDRK